MNSGEQESFYLAQLHGGHIEASAVLSPDVNGLVAKCTYFKNEELSVRLGPQS